MPCVWVGAQHAAPYETGLHTFVLTVTTRLTSNFFCQPTKILTRLTRFTSPVWMLAVGLSAALVLAGHLLPWAAHQTVALTLSANDLAFFTHFTPGAGIFKNEWFYLPIWMAALLLGVLAAQSPWLGRIVLIGLGWGMAGLGLPRYEQWARLLSGGVSLRQFEFGLQLLLSLLVMGLTLVLTLTLAWMAVRRAWAAAWLGVTVGAVAGLVCVVPLVGYLSIRPALEALYGDGVGLGLGWWLTLSAVLVLWAAAFVKIAQTRAVSGGSVRSK